MAKEIENASPGQSSPAGSSGTWRNVDAQPAEEPYSWQADWLEQTPEAVAVWQVDGLVVYWNRGAEQLYGYSRQQALGQTSHQLLQMYHPLSFSYLLDILTKTGKWEGELLKRTADNRQITVDSRMVLLASPGRPTLVVEISRDITHQKQAQEELQAASDAMGQRTDDLLNQVRTLAAQLSESQKAQRRRIVQQMHEELRHLLLTGSIRELPLSGDAGDNLLQFLKRVDDWLDPDAEVQHTLAAQLCPPILHHGNMAQILQWLARWMQDNYGLVVELSADAQANPRSQRIRTVLFHAVRQLLFSASRHARTSRATVTLMPGPDHLRIAIAHDGLTVDPGPAEDSTTSPDADLRAIRLCLEQLGGSLELDSAAGQGTLVILQAPIRTADSRLQQPLSPAQPPSVPSETQAGSSKIRVLLADDHAVVRDGLRRLLQMQPDIEVVAQAADGQEAVDLAMQFRPDVIVLDANMPRLNGVQAARRIAANLPDARIIGLSMYTAADMDVAMRQAGACHYLTKTSSPETVVTAVRACAVTRS